MGFIAFFVCLMLLSMKEIREMIRDMILLIPRTFRVLMNRWLKAVESKEKEQKDEVMKP